MNGKSALSTLTFLSWAITLGLALGMSYPVLGASDLWLQLGPYGPGDFESVAVHPDNPLTVYASGPAGISRTVDGGESWEVLEPTLSGFVQIHPVDPSILYFVGNEGLFKSMDGGANWFSIEPDTVYSPEHLTLDPELPDILFVAGGGVYRSLDGGASWHLSNFGLPDSGMVTALAIHSGNPQVLYAGFRESITSSTNAYTLFRSLDGGDNWEEVSPLKYKIAQIVSDPNDPDVLYVTSGNGPRVLYRTLDGGTTWTTHNPPGSPALREIVLDPNDSSTLLAATGGALEKSGDRGDSWEFFQTPTTLQSLVFDPSSDVWYAATVRGDGPLYQSQDGAESWIVFGEDVHGQEVDQIVVGAEGSSSLFALGKDDDFRSLDDGESWEPLPSFRSELGRVLGPGTLTVDSVTSSLYAGVSYGSEHPTAGLFVSIDEGATWEELPLIGDGFPTSILVHPWDPSTLYVATKFFTNASLFRSFDGGESWESLLEFADGVMEAVIDPVNPSTLYAGNGQGGSFTADGLMKSVDAGTTWELHSDGLPPGEFGNGATFALSVDRINSNNLLASTSEGIYKTTDAALLWWRLDRNWPDNTRTAQLLIDPLIPSTIYAPTRNLGVLRSEDGGATWGDFNEGLNTLNVRHLDLDAQRRLLYAGTQTGVHVRPLVDVALFADPNPIRVCDGAARSTWIQWDAPEVNRTEIRVGTADGPLFAAGREQGTKATGNWVREAMQFFLLDRESGEVLAETTARLTDSGCDTFSADPNPIPVCEGSVGMTTLSWSVATSNGVEIRVGASTGKLMARGRSVGSAATGKWVTDGMQFFLLDRDTAKVLDQLEVHHTQDGCLN